MLNDPIANALSVIMNAEKVGKRECMIRPVSKLLKNIVMIMKDHLYIGEFTETEATGGSYLTINLLGKLNSCGAIKPRFSVKTTEYDKFEKRYLPARGMGMLILSTSVGILTNKEARKKQVGGRLLAYCY